ncbi:hypothetical protein PR048_004126 [Dryococelus australis]|uniref:Uncharacterized protein n=1 Tax=Dryococelus australis TaxID=614101 RepID=A0ABQ9I4L4_9NEOP|nr:hypothetical protein PR048_004126 [Dryococelus australis]
MCGKDQDGVHQNTEEETSLPLASTRQTVDLLKILEGSSYPFAHKLHSKLSDLKICFKLDSDQDFKPETSCLLANPSCMKASYAAKLAAIG